MAMTKAEARKILGECSEDKVFWANDGKTLKKLADLETALKEMSDDTFGYHVNAEKNDFAKWVDEVIGDQRLAADLTKAASRLQAARAVGTRISFLLRVR
jgi:dipeptidase